MFIFLGDLKPKEWLNNASFELDVGNFTVRIEGNRISCISDIEYTSDFEKEVEEPAMLAMKCVQLAQSTETDKTISVDYIAWLEIKLKLVDVVGKFILGNVLLPTEFTINNEKFLSNFTSGLRYANQAFSEINLRVALEDFNRAIDSEWDECIYHCHHCLEAIRDYFGEKDTGWEIMKTKLGIQEKALREVTDFSNDYIRHGSKKTMLKDMTSERKSLQAGISQGVCHAALDLFGKYLDQNGVSFSKVKVIR